MSAIEAWISNPTSSTIEATVTVGGYSMSALQYAYMKWDTYNTKTNKIQKESDKSNTSTDSDLSAWSNATWHSCPNFVSGSYSTYKGTFTFTSGWGNVWYIKFRAQKVGTNTWEYSTSRRVDKQPPSIKVSRLDYLTYFSNSVSNPFSVSSKTVDPTGYYPTRSWVVYDYQYSVDGGAFKSFGSHTTSSDQFFTPEPNLSYAAHTIQVRAYRELNHVQGITSFNIDFTKPWFTQAPSLTINSSNSGTLTFKCSHACNYTVIHYNDIKQGTVAAGTVATIQFSLENLPAERFTVTISRAGNENLACTQTITSDTVLPVISNFEVKPVSASQVLFKFHCTHNVNYEILRSGKLLTSGSGTGNIVRTVDVSDASYYTVKVARSDPGKSQLTAVSGNIYCDNVPAIVEIYEFNLTSAKCVVKARVTNGKSPDSWRLALYALNEQPYNIEYTCSVSGNECTFTIDNVPLALMGNKSYPVVTTIRHSVVRNHVSSSPKHCSSVVYIYVKNGSTYEWRPAVPYVCTCTGNSCGFQLADAHVQVDANNWKFVGGGR